MLVLTYHAELDSLEYKLWDMSSERALLEGLFRGVGGFASHRYHYQHGSGNGTSHTVNHEQAFEHTLETLGLAVPSLERVEGADGEIGAVGHLIHLPQRSTDLGKPVDDDLFEELRSAAEVTGSPDAVHAALAVLEGARRSMNDIPHVVVFDDLASLATSRETVSYAVRSHTTGRELVARLGPGGLRTRSIMGRALDLMGERESRPRMVIVDLDEVCQVVGIRGQSLVDTTHEFDETSRLISARGPGAVSPGLRRALAAASGDGDHVDELLARSSGLACIEDDPLTMEDLASQVQEGTYGSASRMLFDQIIREIGGQLTLMGGIDALVFSGDAGARSASMRAMITTRLRIFKIQVNEQLNEAARDAVDITAEGSRIRVLVVPQDCSREVALETARLVEDGD